MATYTMRVWDKNRTADQTLLGVQLGHSCITLGISVDTVAETLGVSRAIVYRWFDGSTNVSKHLHEKVEQYLTTLATHK